MYTVSYENKFYLDLKINIETRSQVFWYDRWEDLVDKSLIPPFAGKYILKTKNIIHEKSKNAYANTYTHEVDFNLIFEKQENGNTYELIWNYSLIHPLCNGECTETCKELSVSDGYIAGIDGKLNGEQIWFCPDPNLIIMTFDFDQIFLEKNTKLIAEENAVEITWLKNIR